MHARASPFFLQPSLLSSPGLPAIARKDRATQYTQMSMINTQAGIYRITRLRG
jgi:hypothetical protein